MTNVQTSDITAPPAPRVRLIFASLMLVLFLAALDQTIVATALPTIVGELGGLEHLSWVVTAYLLAATVVGPIYGKLGDLHGRKIVLQTAIVLFLAGSALAGLSRNMPELILFRALQGLGGGGLIVSTIAAVGDIIAPRERGRYQGFFGAAFGAATVLGPLLGGFFVDSLSWRWIFYVNLPLGILALGVIGASFPPRRGGVRHTVDYAGVLLLAACLSAVVLFTSLGGTTYPWRSLFIVSLIVLSIALLALFILVERRAVEPILPLELFRNAIVRVTTAVSFIVGFSLFGASTFLPLYLQTVKGRSPTASGLLMTPMMAGVLLTSISSGQLISRWGRYRPFPIAGTAIMTLALLLLSRLAVETSLWRASLTMLVLGMGLGLVMQVLVIAAQNAVDYRHLGVASSSTILFRQIGGSIGVSLFGAIFSNQLAATLAGKLPDGAALPAHTTPAMIQQLPAAVRAVYLEAVVNALHPVFLVAAGVAIFGFAAAWRLREAPLRSTTRALGSGEALAAPSEASSLDEITRALTRLGHRNQRWEAYERLAVRAGLTLSPPELWLLARLGERAAPSAEELAAELDVDVVRVRAAAEQLSRDALLHIRPTGALELTAAGHETYARLVAARREGLRALLAGWDPDKYLELRQLLDRLARDFTSEIPLPPARADDAHAGLSAS
jgi:EmrB/QacA subfamily drug resistance transporter